MKYHFFPAVVPLGFDEGSHVKVLDPSVELAATWCSLQRAKIHTWAEKVHRKPRR